MNKRGQGWSFDVMIASFIFSAAFASFFFFIINSPDSSQEKIESLKNQGDNLANILLSEGFPSDWNSSNVAKPGILTENKINTTKLSSLQSLPYFQAKNLFNIEDEYYIDFSESSISPIGNYPLNTENLIKIERLTIYENKPITVNIQLWE